MVTSSEDGTVKIWDTRCDRGGNVRIWDLGENKCTHQLIPEEDVSVASVTVATDGTLLCAGNNSVSFCFRTALWIL